MSQIDISADVNMIWNLLVSRGRATDEQLEEVLDESIRNGMSFQRVLYNYEIIDEDSLLKLVAEDLGTEFVEIRTGELDEELIELLSADVARTYGIIPLKQTEDSVTLVADNPFDPRLIDELHFVLNRECIIQVGRPKDVEEALDLFYPEKGGSINDVLEEIKSLHKEEDLSNADQAELEKAANDAPIVRFVNIILQQAIKDQASDIHFEPFVDEFRIRYRIDGALYEMAPPPKHLAIPVISRIKVMSGLNIAERRLPQDGRIELRINRKPIDLRVSTLPTRYGESVVLRVLDRSVVSLSLDNLGMTPAMTKEIRHMIKQPNGIFLVTGPTGSGKTTTLYSGLREINTMEDKLLTAEDPVEYDIEGILQLPIREGIGMTFPRALRAFLRQDPDRIMVGEIRDVETAGIAIQASLTGHLVLSTLHTNDAAGAVTRLIDMGIEPFLISSTVIGVLAQRLIRRCCNNCKTAYIPDDRELRMLGITREDIAGKPFYRGGGCELCNGSGYKGRVGIFELLHISEAIQGMINRRMPTQDIKRKAIEEGLLTLRQDGINQVLLGVSTAAEVLQYTMAN
ncbi:MAG: ATPase, T2SS/T4P/T4SS family [Lentisphaeria bacterium]|nr:ATPase, T2SS/T4P/T4SS family [Lentisphaeria bacterium]MDY0176055.1 ATPase, T2SS/T4P/T4SS family [Lentisphaeria bacterium]NLZ59427.1 Flp pilus assembly complex ATPase component TadA [Lentisphaerota bacterium]